ncbi:TolC family protein, partial [Caldithrix abyssi]
EFTFRWMLIPEVCEKAKTSVKIGRLQQGDFSQHLEDIMDLIFGENMKIVIALITAFVIVIGCAGPVLQVKQVEPRPVIEEVTSAGSLLKGELSPEGTITVLKALQLALQSNPQLTVFSLEIRAREAAALQESFLPNPELAVEVENFAGGGALAGFKASETTISLGQLIELAGKRARRTQAAALQAELAGWDFESKRLEVYAQVVKNFYDVLAIQKLVKLNKEILTLTEEFKDQISLRVTSGRTSPAELSRAEVEVANARIALEQSQRRLQAARQRLAATWGATTAAFDSVTGNFENVSALPAFEALQNALQKNPEWLRWDTETRLKQAQLALAKALRIPDPTITAGYRRFNDLGQQAFVAGFSIPLNIFNRNQGGIKEAALRAKQTAFQETFSRLQLQTELSTMYQNISAVQQSIFALKNEIIPKARQAFETISRGYQLGKFNFLEVLDARRSLFSARQAYLQNLADYHQLRAEIERLTGKSLESFKIER